MLLNVPQSRDFVYAGHMAIRAEPAGLSAARQQVVRVARELAFDDDVTNSVLLAVGEALSNAYRHGTSDPSINLIYLGWHFAGDVLTITIKDEGPGFLPFEVCSGPTGDARARGCGIRLMRESMDEVSFEWDDGAVVVLRKHIRCAQLASQPVDTTAESPRSVVGSTDDVVIA